MPWELAHIETWASSPRRQRSAAAAEPLPAPTLERALETSEEIAGLAGAEPARALKVAQAFVEMAKSTGERPVLAVARRCRGHVERRLGRFRDALRDYGAARRDLAAMGYGVEAARTDIGTVVALGHMGRPTDARRMANRARAILLRAGEEGRAARLDVNLALISEKFGKPRDALLAYRRAERVFERLGAKVDLAQTHFNRANALVAMDRYDEALAQYRSSAEVWRERGATATLCRCQLAIGSILFKLGRLDEAISHLEGAHDAASSLDDPELEATAALDLARAEILLDRHDSVEERLGKAIKGFEKMAMPAERAEALGLRGTLRLRRGRAEEALSDWTTARRTYHGITHRSGTAWADFWRASLLVRLGRGAESRAILRRALATLRSAGSAAWEAEARLLLAEQEVGRRPREAARELTRVGRLAGTLGDPWIAYRLSLARARVALRIGHAKDARRELIVAYRAARRLQSVLPLETLQAHWSERRGELHDLAIDRGVVPDSGAGRAGARWLLEWSERARALRGSGPHGDRPHAPGGAGFASARDGAAFASAREELHWLDARERVRRFAGDGGAGGGGPREAARTAARGRRELGQWRRRRAETIARLDRWTRRLEIQEAARGRGWLYAEPNPSEIQRALAPDEALVEFWTRDSALVTLVVTRSAIHATTATAGVGEASEATHRLRHLWNRHRLGAQFSGRHDESLAATASHLLGTLKESVLDPALAHIPAGTRRLVVSPHGWLRSVPFHALAVAASASGVLGDAYDVRYTLSGQWLADHPPQGRATSGPALIAGHSSPDAPDAEAEARAIANLYTGATLLTGDAATPAALRAHWSDAPTIHVAAHGATQTADPRLSGIPLAGGTWTVHEIRAVDTRADLVVLSSCQSGETVLWGGDHHVGLLPALFESGARAAVVSLWPADDATTRILMTSFHHGLASGRPVGEALLAAQHVVRAVKPSPYYWAPFVLYGAESRGEMP
jgi:CHAT domain-containing protein/tetratricopeptide (TPR) repeat protein